MTLCDLTRRSSRPRPWGEGDNIPWHDPGFSRRMLAEHLSQDHDLASRRAPTIDAHVESIHSELLGRSPARVLDLGCGPGLYASRLARLGHQIVGIDCSPASIGHARATAAEEDLRCTYLEGDFRSVPFGGGFDLAMLIYGELNVLRPEDAKLILGKARDALVSGGTLLLEPHTLEAVRAIGETPPSWYSAESGLFSERPHVCLQEHFWDPGSATATIRYFVIDADSGGLERHAQTFQAYSSEAYKALLEEQGFGDVRFVPSLSGEAVGSDDPLLVILARR
jgi:SAM-dependent methyltransferase